MSPRMSPDEVKGFAPRWQLVAEAEREEHCRLPFEQEFAEVVFPDSKGRTLAQEGIAELEVGRNDDLDLRRAYCRNNSMFVALAMPFG